MILNVIHTVRLGDRCLLLGALAIWCNLLVAWYHGGLVGSPLVQASGVISGGVRDFGETWRCQVMDAAADRLGWEFAGRLN